MNAMKRMITSAFAALVAAIGLIGGCSTPPPPSASAPKPGKGIAEYREVGRVAHQSVDATVKALENLALSPTQTSVPVAALPKFDKAMSHLEITSIKVRARAEAIIARGESYFEEWRENLAAITNQATAKVETERYNRLFEHFGKVREHSGTVREEFKPFMAKLREFRAAADQHASVISSVELQKQIGDLTNSGRRVLKALDAVGAALNAAETEMHQPAASQH